MFKFFDNSRINMAYENYTKLSGTVLREADVYILNAWGIWGVEVKAATSANSSCVVYPFSKSNVSANLSQTRKHAYATTCKPVVERPSIAQRQLRTGYVNATSSKPYVSP